MHPITARQTGISIEDICLDFEDYRYRTPIKFGGTALDRVTLLNVSVNVRTGNGRAAAGFGSMPLGNIWSFPSKTLGYERTLAAMKRLAEALREITRAWRGAAHPVDINWALEPLYFQAAEKVGRELQLGEPIPRLCTLVTASPIDAALHDAFGKAHGINCFRGYGPDLMDYDLARYLGPEFGGEYIERYVSATAKPSMPVYHLVGALDPIFDSDIRTRLNDGIPETLREWILADGLTHIKIKLNGNDLEWDVERVLTVDRAAIEAQAGRGVETWYYSLDFNEQCPHVEYLLDFLRRVRGAAPGAFDRVQYIEQPTARDLRARPDNKMHEAARIKPVVIDESLVDYESLLLARELGYSGVALKACKGQSNALLMAAAAQKFKMFLCVQDLTCPGASLVHSAGLAAHIPTVAGIESNARQYVPAANDAWKGQFPSIFKIRDGRMETAVLDGPGLSLHMEGKQE